MHQDMTNQGAKISPVLQRRTAMRPLSPTNVFFVIFGCVALSFIKDPMQYLGACAVYGILLALTNLIVTTLYFDEENNDSRD